MYSCDAEVTDEDEEGLPVAYPLIFFGEETPVDEQDFVFIMDNLQEVGEQYQHRSDGETGG